MKSGTRAALAVGAGYVLGRRRKMRMALMLGGAAMAGSPLAGPAGQLLRRGTKLVGSTDLLGKLSPELGDISGIISKELVPVGKAAARAAVTGRVNALSDRVHERAEALREPQGGADDEDERPARGRQARGAEEEDDEDERPARRRQTRAAAEGAEDEDDEDERPARRTVRAAGGRAQAPVRRTRR